MAATFKKTLYVEGVLFQYEDTARGDLMQITWDEDRPLGFRDGCPVFSEEASVKINDFFTEIERR